MILVDTDIRIFLDDTFEDDNRLFDIDTLFDRSPGVGIAKLRNLRIFQFR